MTSRLRAGSSVAVAVLALGLGAHAVVQSPAGGQTVATEPAPVLHPAGLPLTVELLGKDFQWQATYPGADQQLHTADDLTVLDRWHLPADCRVTIQLRSADYLYSFKVPQINKDQIAVPDLTFDLKLSPQPPGRLAFVGDQFCGGRHKKLSGQFSVDTSADFNAWLAARTDHP